ncbi:MAG: 50S ribosomal protein L9 [Spirochaetales bacterium]|nr:50S ribosomal protein L9 [Spirochaetales bacterium]
MKIILNEDVLNLGEEGDVREVARGYARNYLFRKGYAVPYNKQNVALFEQRKAIIEKRKEEKRVAAAGMKEKLEAVKLEMVMPAGDTGKLFGSVTAGAIAEELEKHGFSIEKKKIEIPGTTIKMIGDHTIKIRLYENETAQCGLSITAEKRSSGKAAGKAAPAKKEEEASPVEDEISAAEAAEEAVKETEEEAMDAADVSAEAEDDMYDEDMTEEDMTEEDMTEEDMMEDEDLPEEED